MARITYPDPDLLPEADRNFLADLPQLNFHRLIAGSPSMFRPLVSLFSSCLSNGLLDARIREIAILRTGHLCDGEYEVVHHNRVARLISMSEEEILALAPDGDDSVFTPHERIVLKFTNEVVQQGGARQETFDAAAEFLSTAQLIELTTVIGMYTMVSQICHTFEIELEDVPIANTGIEDMQATVAKHRQQ
ncbi:MAG: carboxymuconolactone decarboxylase family protein [Gammaproteobacteria bacterium]|jgi:alkylhydroperoxidase family enzyme|nr:carboxymuconolactone decarboxylase [Chromatiales bacterium]MDP6675415.1 carboxymuconolactone decarboxylase family protein [Gammaproteobacteria bacterium]